MRSRSSLASGIVHAILAVAAVATALSVVLLWPHGKTTTELPEGFREGIGVAAPVVTGSVDEVRPDECNPASAGRVLPTGIPVAVTNGECSAAVVTLASGPDAHQQVLLPLRTGPAAPDLAAGDAIRLTYTETPEGATGIPQGTAPASPYTYAFDDYDRSSSLPLWLGIGAAIILLVAFFKGLRALIAIAATLVVVVMYMVPAITAGSPATVVAISAACAVLFLVMYFVHGPSKKTSAALLGTIISLAGAAALTQWAVASTRLTGLSNESTVHVMAYFPNLDVRDLLMAAFVLGAVGVLNDVTISQSATVFELAQSDPSAGRWSVFRRALSVGQDHIASMLYTLVLAYAGASLSLFTLFSLSQRSAWELVTSDLVAVEVVRALVGGAALAASVPLTNWIAVLLAVPSAAERRRGAIEGGHAFPGLSTPETVPETTPETLPARRPVPEQQMVQEPWDERRPRPRQPRREGQLRSEGYARRESQPPSEPQARREGQPRHEGRTRRTDEAQRRRKAEARPSTTPVPAESSTASTAQPKPQNISDSHGRHRRIR